MSNTDRTEISSIGEFGLINRIKQNFPIRLSDSIMGIGDDAAVLSATDQQRVVSTDLLIEGVHFDLKYVPLAHLGYKAVSVNVSDIAAMNAIPTQITVSIAISNRFSVEAIDELYKGIQAACENYNVDLIGGDTTSSPVGLLISVTAIGKADAKDIVYRKGASKGDIICVTGDLGGAYLGLQILEAEKQAFMADPNAKPELEEYSYIVGRQLKPIARMDVIHELKEHNVVPTSMIDVSDGLASELLHLANASNLGLRIFEDKIPIDKETYDVAINKFNITPSVCALNGGEDYELLFTIKQEDYEKIKNHNDISFIGYMSVKEDNCMLISRNEQLVPLKAQGWVHF